MLTVPEAARRTGRNPETIRRWIRAGRLRSAKVGTQHLIEEEELATLIEPAESAPPGGWGRLASGAPAPNWVELLHASREGR